MGTHDAEKQGNVKIEKDWEETSLHKILKSWLQVNTEEVW